MAQGDEDTPFAGRPMEPSALIDDGDSRSSLPKKANLVTLDSARNSLPTVKRLIPLLQSLQDQAIAITGELDILMDGLLSTDPHVIEISDFLANIVVEWQAATAAITLSGAIINSIDPAIIEWYGVVDGRLALYCWSEGEVDIEWFHWPEESYNSRRPILEV